MEKVKVLIVAKTRRGGGACIGGITLEGRSVRLQAANRDTDEQANLVYQVGEVWEVDGDAATHPDPAPCGDPGRLRPPARRGRWRIRRPLWPSTWRQSAAASTALYDGLLQATRTGALYHRRAHRPARLQHLLLAPRPAAAHGHRQQTSALPLSNPRRRSLPGLRRLPGAHPGNSCRAAAAGLAGPLVAAPGQGGRRRTLLCAALRLVSAGSLQSQSQCTPPARSSDARRNAAGGHAADFSQTAVLRPIASSNATPAAT